MGGRGSSSGISNSGKPYGTEYKSLLTYGNIKFVVRLDGNTTSPMETMTQNRVYVTLDNNGNPKFITYYDKNNKRERQIDLDVPHKGIIPHTHHGYFHSENDSPKGASNPTTKEKELINLVYSIWEGKKSNVWTKWKDR